MKHFTSTRAKQNFGQLLAAAAVAPVAIERHGKVQAIVAAPAAMAASAASLHATRAPRELDRLNQRLTEQNRLVRHLRIALDLVTRPARERDALIAGARSVVERWRREQLCSRDYIDRWSEILALPVREMALRMTSDCDGWGAALRQNSPWAGVHA